MSLAAGLATLELLTREAIDRLNAAGERLRADLQRAFDEAGVPPRSPDSARCSAST